MDAAFIAECADPSLTPAIVEQFVESVGSRDPLAITVKSGGRLILVPKAQTAEEAMDIIRENVGQAIVRVGLTQFPAGVGVKDASELKPDLIEPCGNLRMGTKMFAKIMRIVAKWYGNPTAKDVLPQIFEDAVYSWKTGQFEGESVFQAEDPGGTIVDRRQDAPVTSNEPADATPAESEAEPSDDREIGSAGIRVDLSRIGGEK